MGEPGWDEPVLSPIPCGMPMVPTHPLLQGQPGGPEEPCRAAGRWRGCTHQLDRDHQDGFEREGPITQIEEIFQAGSE